MSKWNSRITLPSVEGPITDSNAATIGNGVADAIESKFKRRLDFEGNPDNFDFQLDDVVGMLREVTGFETDEGMITPHRELEMRLNELYDWADRNRVWIEPNWLK